MCLSDKIGTTETTCWPGISKEVFVFHACWSENGCKVCRKYKNP